MGETVTATITVVMTDLVDSTRLLRHGPEAFDAIRRDHLDTMRQAIALHRGVEVKSTGDGIMATFTSAADAVAAAVGVQQGVARLQRRDPRSPAVRVGLSCGEATSEDGDWYGAPVIEAARLCAEAEPGQILTTSVVPVLVGGRGDHSFVPLGERELKGFEQPTGVVEVEWAPASTSGSLPPSAEQAAAGFLVGRAEELERLRIAWKEAQAGNRRVVLVSGEPGIGKTRLAAELAKEAHADGGVVLWGRCDEELDVGYQPFAEAVRHWAATAGDLLDAIPDRVGLARLLPEAAGQAGAVDITGSDVERDRLRLFAAVSGLLAVQGAQAPVLLVLDDVHWAAAPTLLLLRHVVRDPAPVPLLVVATYRDTELDRTHPLAATLADLRREPNVERLSLSGLTEAGVVEFLEAAAGHALGPAAVDLAGVVHAETEGNAFFVGQVLRHLVETGALAQVDGEWTMTRPLGELGIPEGVREVVGRRLSHLSDTANRVLSVAAVAGREFDLRVLEAVAEVPGDGALDAVEEAIAARLVDEVPGAPGRFTFAHALVRQTLLAELTAARRARVHRRIADALAALPNTQPALLAHHYIEGAASGCVAEAAQWTYRAVEEAWWRLAFEEGIALAKRGLDVLDLDPDPRWRALILVGLSRNVQYVGDTDAAVAYAEEAIAEAEMSGDAAAYGEAVLARYAWARAGVAEPDVDDRVADALLRLGDSDPLRRAQLLSLAAFTKGVSGSQGTAVEPLARTAVEAAREVGDIATLVMSLYIYSTVVMGSPELAKQRWALEQIDAALAGASAEEREHNEFIRVRVAVVVAAIEGDRGVIEDAISFARALAGGPGIGLIPAATASMWEAMLALADGDLDRAEAKANELLVLDDPNFANSWASISFRIALERGTAGDAVPLVRAALEQTPGLVALHSLLAQALVAAGEVDEARTIYRRLAADGFGAVPRDVGWSVSLAQLTELCVALDERESAEALHELLQPFAGQILVVAWGVYIPGAADRYLAMLDLLLGRLDDAERRLAAAIELEERFGAPALVATTRSWQERVRRAR